MSFKLPLPKWLLDAKKTEELEKIRKKNEVSMETFYASVGPKNTYENIHKDMEKKNE